jgi:hypothetical protein
MPLFDLSRRHLSETSRDKHMFLASLRRNINNLRTMTKLERIVNFPINYAVKNSLRKKLVFTKAGFLIGHQSIAPHKDVNYFWEKISMATISKSSSVFWDKMEERQVLRTVGAFVIWVMSKRPEDWTVDFQDNGKYDFVTGKEIKVATYWIVPPPKLATVLDLQSKYNIDYGMNSQL